ncbi:hypothetical protein BS50DRAFT_56146 [Corynespora cassiicola Philippines]|uniref:Uncharacterized protein n=1 Tax=Corynespora cassiicola Philippines TaxID=1448308 RepID=A0A2T2NIU0_CORCC|nr:hypothetical protein BS50DRAFT_56146 [Corynespora cassiicola Philippines]
MSSALTCAFPIAPMKPACSWYAPDHQSQLSHHAQFFTNMKQASKQASGIPHHSPNFSILPSVSIFSSFLLEAKQNNACLYAYDTFFRFFSASWSANKHLRPRKRRRRRRRRRRRWWSVKGIRRCRESRYIT